MSKIVDLNDFKSKKQLDDSISPGRVPLYKTHLNEEHASRILRIRASLERINKLMSEIKKVSEDHVVKTQN